MEHVLFVDVVLHDVPVPNNVLVSASINSIASAPGEDGVTVALSVVELPNAIVFGVAITPLMDRHVTVTGFTVTDVATELVH